MIEYASVMSKEEIGKFSGSIIKKNIINKGQAVDYLKSIEEILVTEYDAYQAKSVAEYYGQKKRNSNFRKGMAGENMCGL
jgi:hypothetical protein